MQLPYLEARIKGHQNGLKCKDFGGDKKKRITSLPKHETYKQCTEMLFG